MGLIWVANLFLSLKCLLILYILQNQTNYVISDIFWHPIYVSVNYNLSCNLFMYVSTYMLCACVRVCVCICVCLSSCVCMCVCI